MAGALVVKFLILYGLPFLYEILYKFVVAKFGKSLVNLASTNIATLDEHIELKQMTSEDAERANVAMIQAATRQSPPITKSDAKLINLACYVKHLKENKPDKYREWMQRAERWFSTRHKRTETDFSIMGLYINPPDRRKPSL